MRPRSANGQSLPILFACLCVGAILGWWARGAGPPLPVRSEAVSVEPPPAVEPHVVATIGAPKRPAPESVAPAVAAAPPVVAGSADAIGALRGKHLRIPIDHAEIEAWKGEFAQRREGTRAHEAVDILAPRNTPIRAVEDGTIAKLFESKAGGHTIYQFDPSGRFCYYYAHLERYAEGLADGARVSKGDVIGYVGTSGNAPPGTPHLHFTIFELTPQHRWWQGRPIDPYLVFHG